MRSIECPLDPLSLKNVSKGLFPCPASQAVCYTIGLQKWKKSSETLVWYFFVKGFWIFEGFIVMVPHSGAPFNSFENYGKLSEDLLFHQFIMFIPIFSVIFIELHGYLQKNHRTWNNPGTSTESPLASQNNLRQAPFSFIYRRSKHKHT